MVNYVGRFQHYIVIFFGIVIALFVYHMLYAVRFVSLSTGISLYLIKVSFVIGFYMVNLYSLTLSSYILLRLCLSIESMFLDFFSSNDIGKR